MWMRGFVRSLKYDAVPRTMILIEQFNRVVAVTFDTMHGAEFQHVDCTQRVVMTLKGIQPVVRRPCRIEADD